MFTRTLTKNKYWLCAVEAKKNELNTDFFSSSSIFDQTEIWQTLYKHFLMHEYTHTSECNKLWVLWSCASPSNKWAAVKVNVFMCVCADQNYLHIQKKNSVAVKKLVRFIMQLLNRLGLHLNFVWKLKRILFSLWNIFFFLKFYSIDIVTLSLTIKL